jgi:hypothetical protein
VPKHAGALLYHFSPRANIGFTEVHNVFDLGGAWESPALNNGQTYTLTFAIPGTSTYVCSIHSGMQGTISVVEPEPAPQTKIYIATMQH